MDCEQDYPIQLKTMQESTCQTMITETQTQEVFLSDDKVVSQEQKNTQNTCLENQGVGCNQTFNEGTGWNYVPCEFKDIDFEKYEKENLEHLKKVYKPPQLSDIVEDVQQDGNVLKVQTINPFSIPKCNVQSLDMSFLESDWICKEIKPDFIMYSPKRTEQEEEEESNDTNPIIDKKWCRDVQVIFEERDKEGGLIDKYRVTKQLRRIKLQGHISVKWYSCLEQMKLKETKWFKFGKQYLAEIGQDMTDMVFLKIEVVHLKPLALSEYRDLIDKQNPSSLNPIIYEDYNLLVKKADELNNQAKVFFTHQSYEQSGKLFNRAYSLWRGMTKKLRKTLTSEQVQEFNEKFNQYGGNYAQCLINLKNYQECIEFYKQSKLTSSKNLYKLAKCHFELHEYEKAIKTLDSYSSCSSNQQQTSDNPSSTQETLSIPVVLPLEFEKLKVQCQAKNKLLETQSINTFYRKLFQ